MTTDYNSKINYNEIMNQTEIEENLLQRVNFDQYIQIQEWIIKQIESKL